MKPSKLFFGTAGIPSSTNPHNTIEGVKRAGELGLGSMELEFVRNVNISKEKAPLVREAAEKSNVILTCHGSYYINLNSLEKEKVKASAQRIMQAARILDMCKGWSLTFHAAYYLGMSPDKTYTKTKKEIQSIVKKLQNEGINLWIRPETTGKGTQFGELKEILKLGQEIEKVMPCIDFAHLHARTNGKYNTSEEYREVLETVERFSGKQGLQNMHIHISGIEYGEKGERNHLMLKKSDLNYLDMLKVWKEFKIKGVVTCESPNPEPDALMLQKKYNK